MNLFEVLALEPEMIAAHFHRVRACHGMGLSRHIMKPLIVVLDGERKRQAAMRVAGLVICLCLGAMAGSLGSADETPVVGIGGTYVPMDSHPDVRLVREFVRVELSPHLARTIVQFEFRNEGPDQIVRMGFPEQVVYDRGQYRSFRVTDNGRPVSAEPTEWVEELPETSWTRLWVSAILFHRNERHIIRVWYEERPALDPSGCYTYRYVFGTGRAWKGPIGAAEVLVILKGFPPERTVLTSTQGATRRGNRLAWRFANWEPDEHAILDLAVAPHIMDIAFDKTDPDPPMQWCMRQGAIEAELRGLAYWMHASLAWSPGRTVSIHHQGKQLALTAGSRKGLLEPEHRTVDLPFAPYLQEGRLQVPVRAVCEALGFHVHAEQDPIGNWRVRISEGERTAGASSEGTRQLPRG